MKILIADDSSFIRSILTKMIRSNFEFSEVIPCANGVEAYEKYMECRPEVVVTDLLMPQMSGQQFLSKIKDEGFETKAIVVSADIQSRTKEELEEIGIAAFINKPLTQESLQLVADEIRRICQC